MTTLRSLFRPLLLALVLVLLALPARAQDNLASNPGYVDPSLIEGWFDAQPNIEINLRGALLRMVADATDESEPELSGLLGRIQGIYVRGYTDSAVTRRGNLRQGLDRLTGRLRSDGWETIVRVREDEEDINIQLRMNGDEAIAGLMVLVNSSDAEHIFINIVGDIRPEELGRIGRSFNIDPLKELPSDTTD